MALRVRSRRTAWIALTVVAVVVLGFVGFAGRTLNPTSLKARVIEAARRATGRDMTIAGDVGIRFALRPTVTMDDVALANPPGFSRPDMVKVARVELRVALWPLLRHRLEIDYVTLLRPEVVLETDRTGRPNWVFTRAAPVMTASPSPEQARPAPIQPQTTPSQPPVAVAPPVATAKRRYDVAFKGVNVMDGRFGWVDARSGHDYFGEVPRLDLDASRFGAGELTGSIVFGGRTIGLTARADPSEASDTGALPVNVRLESGGASLTVDARIPSLTRGRGYTVVLDANVPEPSVLAAFFPRFPLASLHNATAHAEVGDSGGPLPSISALQIKVGSVDLAIPELSTSKATGSAPAGSAPAGSATPKPTASGDLPISGLSGSGITAALLSRLPHDARLHDVTLTARGDAPIEVAAQATMSGVDSTISGTGGDLRWLAAGASAPVAVGLTWKADSAEATVKGTIQRPVGLKGVALDMAVSVPDPSLVVHDVPPALKDVLFRARLTDAPAPTLFQVTSSAGDLAGQVTVTQGPRLSVVGQVWSRFLDVDLLRGLPPAPGGAGRGGDVPGTDDAGRIGAGQGSDDVPLALLAPESPPRAGGTADVPPTPPGSASPGAAAGMGLAPKPRAAPLAFTGPIIPDTKLPFDLIRAADGNLAFTLGELHIDGASVRKIDGVVAVKDGVLRLDPLTISALAQRLSGILVVDAAKSPPLVHTEFTAPGLAVFPLLAAIGLPQMATGHLAVRADLTGSGDTPRALAASVSGWLGMAVEDGQVDARLIGSWLEHLQPLRIGGPRVADVKCFAVRADAKEGVVTIQPMALDTASLIIEGNGDVDLRRETLALRLRPRARIGGTGIALPVRVTGSMRDPSAKIDISSKGIGGGALAGLILGGGKDVMGAAGGGDPCPDALARARAGAPK